MLGIFNRCLTIALLLGAGIPLLSSPALGNAGNPAVEAHDPSEGRTLPLPECVASDLATRTGRSDCWAKFALSETSFVCVPRSIWATWLMKPEPSRICIEGGKWKGFAPSVNDGGEKSPRFEFRLVTAKFSTKNAAASRLGFFKLALTHRIERLRETLSAWLEPEDRFGICRALLLNENAAKDATGMLRFFGFVHLLTATGIHLYALAHFMSLFLAFLFSRSGVPVRWGLPAKRALVLGCWAFGWMLSGMRYGMLRPWFIIAARSLARFLGLEWQRWSPLAVALAIDLAVAFAQGSSHSQSGRWIYALAVGGGMMAIDSVRAGQLRTHLLLAVGSWSCVALWEFWEYGIGSVATPLLSLITLPIMTWVTYPLLLLGSVCGALGWSALARSLLHVASTASSRAIEVATERVLKFGSIWLVDRQSLALGAFAACALLLAAWVTRSRQKSGIAWVLAGVVLMAGIRGSGIASAPSVKKSVEITQLDVGQGDSALVSLPGGPGGQAGLIDSGSERSLSDLDWMRLFGKRGIRELSWIALTHLDEDHSGGVKRLARLMPISCVVTSKEQLESDRGKEFARELQEFGIHVSAWSEGCFPFPRFKVPEPRHRARKSKGNNSEMSAILIPLAHGGFYFNAGDSDEKKELAALQWAQSQGWLESSPSPQGRRILKVSHHGSRFASGEVFLKTLAPTEAWISSGLGNRYGHPAPSVLELLTRLRIPVHRTDFEGALH